MKNLLVLLTLASALLLRPAGAQDLETLTQAYPDSLCPDCAEWDAPQEPFPIHGDTFYVGTRGLSSILITSPEGHILIDGALPSSAPKILENIRALGFDPADVKLILNSHAHYDHAGGIAALRKVTGARAAASPLSAPVLKNGRCGPDDPQYGMHLDYPAVGEVEIFTPGDTLRVGSLAITSHATGGHTPGGTSWSWKACDGDRCMEVVYADSQTAVSADGFRFTDSETYPTALKDFERGLKTLEELPCHILITTHPSASSLWERLADDGLADPNACRRYAAAARRGIAKRVASETPPLRVLTLEAEPFFYFDATGRPAGLEHEIVQGFAASQGCP